MISTSTIELNVNKTFGNVVPRKKLTKRRIKICLSECRYTIVKSLAQNLNFQRVVDTDAWDIYWTDFTVSILKIKNLKRYQRINHFPGMIEICRKDLLARNLKRMSSLFPEEYSFYPSTWCLPADFSNLMDYHRTHKNQTYILKPDAGCQGKGISLVRSLKKIDSSEKIICQLYLPKPFLIDGFKFDLRIYVLITSYDPLRIFIYNDGLVRLSTAKYTEPNSANLKNFFMHLTNYSINKHSDHYNPDFENGTKRNFHCLNSVFQKKGVDRFDLWSEIDDIVIKTIISAYPIVKRSYNVCFPLHDAIAACFELLGFDILLDENLRPYLLEVNHSPSFHVDTDLDYQLKYQLLQDTLLMVSVDDLDKAKILEDEKIKSLNRLSVKSENLIAKRTENQGLLKVQESWENNHLGNYRPIYPTSHSTQKYEKFFKQLEISLFDDTVASRARHAAIFKQREEFEMKQKLEGMKLNGRTTDDGFRGESERNFRRMRINRTFLPERICKIDEIRRLKSLEERDAVIRQYNIIDGVYQLLKSIGSLKPIDEEKYGRGEI